MRSKVTQKKTYSEKLIIQKVFKQWKTINLNEVIIQFYFHCVWMTMNNILTSGGLT